MRYSLRSMLTLTVVLSVVLFACKFLFDAVTGSVLPYEVVRQLQVGMSSKEVESLVGPPSKSSGQRWIYEKWGNPGYFEIEFDDVGKLEWFRDESAYPAMP